MKKLLIILLSICVIYSQDIVSIDDIYISIIESANIKMPENGKDFTKEQKEMIRINTLNYLINEYNIHFQKEKSHEKALINLLAHLGYDSNFKFKDKGKNNYEISFYVDKELEYKVAIYLYDILTLVVTEKYGLDAKAELVLYKDKALKVVKGK